MAREGPWLLALAAGLWVGGLSIVLSALSYHVWLAAVRHQKIGAVCREASWTISFSSGLVLVCLGFGVAPRAAAWERTWWLGAAAALAVLLLARLAKRSDHPPGTQDGGIRPRSDNRGFGLPHLLGALTVIGVLAVVVPAFLATAVNRDRLQRARTGVTRLAAAAASLLDPGVRPAPEGRASGAGRPAAVLATEGEMPRADCCAEWVPPGGTGPLLEALARSGRLPSPDLAALGPDPWGNAYLVNIAPPSGTGLAAAAPRAVWVLSAGPNGRVETRYDQDPARAALGGDDIGARVR